MAQGLEEFILQVDGQVWVSKITCMLFGVLYKEHQDCYQVVILICCQTDQLCFINTALSELMILSAGRMNLVTQFAE